MTLHTVLLALQLLNMVFGIYLLYKTRLGVYERPSKTMIYHSIYLSALVTPGIGFMMTAGLYLEWRHISKQKARGLK